MIAHEPFCGFAFPSQHLRNKQQGRKSWRLHEEKMLMSYGNLYEEGKETSEERTSGTKVQESF
jgi:hypothetical protein